MTYMHQTGRGAIVRHDFPSVRLAGGDVEKAGEAALRQFSLHRLMAYGASYEDAFMLRRLVSEGHDWSDTAEAIAERISHSRSGRDASHRAAALAYRASALYRISQMIMLEDSDRRRSLFLKGADLFAAATQFDRELDITRITLEAPNGRLAAWYCQGRGPQQAAVIVFGGVEGWAMDLLDFARAFAEQGMATLLVDGPGQGESRFLYRTFLTDSWVDDMLTAVDWLTERLGARPLGIVGNSMGGSFVPHIAAADSRIAAVCNNGGAIDPLSQKQRGSFFRKMVSFCTDGSMPDDEVDRIWQTVSIKPETMSFNCPYLIVHGVEDPLVSREVADEFLRLAQTTDKSLHLFEGGDHCVYVQSDTKFALVGEWMANRLGVAPFSSAGSAAGQSGG